MEYTVVEKYTLVELVNEVNKFAREGWIPFGDLIAGTNFYQAMTRGDARKVQGTDEEKASVKVNPA